MTQYSTIEPGNHSPNRPAPSTVTESVYDRERRIRSAKLSMSQTFYLITLNQFLGKNPHAWPKQETIAKAMNATDRGVRNWQKELEALGILEVVSGQGNHVSNRYRLNLDRLIPKPIEEQDSSGEPEPRSAFQIDDDAEPEKYSGSVRNRIPVDPEQHSGLRRNSIPVEPERGSDLKNKKEHKKESHSGNSRISWEPAATEKPSKEIPKDLIAFCHEWNAWHSAGIVRQSIRDPNNPGKTLQDAWTRSQRDREQRDRLRDLTGIRAQIAVSQELLQRGGWFDAAGLIGGRNSNRRWYADQLIAGAYRDKLPPAFAKSSAVASSEAVTEWQRIQAAARRNYGDESGFEAEIGQRLTSILKRLGLTRKAVESAKDFDRRQQEQRFIQAFVQQGAAA